MLEAAQPLMWDQPKREQPWYEKQPYSPANLMLDAAAKFFVEPLYNIASGKLMRDVSAPRNAVPMSDDPREAIAVQEYNRLNAAQALGSGMEAGGIAALGSFGTKTPSGMIKNEFPQMNKIREAYGYPEPETISLLHGSPSAQKISESGKLNPSFAETNFYGDGLYLTQSQTGSSKYALDYGGQGRTEADNSSPGVFPLDVTGRFAQLKDLHDYANNLPGKPYPYDVGPKAFADAGFDGFKTNDGKIVVVFPERQGAGIVKGKFTGQPFYSNTSIGAPVTVNSEDKRRNR